MTNVEITCEYSTRHCLITEMYLRESHKVGFSSRLRQIQMLEFH